MPPPMSRLLEFLRAFTLRTEQTLTDFPHQMRSSLSAGNINDQSLRAMDALNRLDEIRTPTPARN